MKAIIIGTGKMGHLIEQTLQAQGDEVLAKCDLFTPDLLEKNIQQADIILDFSHHDNLDWFLPLAIKNKVAVVEGTTMLSGQQMNNLEEASREIPVFFSANYSLGVAVMKKLAAMAAQLLKDWDIEIVETHHNKKADAPSGTALAILDAIDPKKEYTPVFGRSPESNKREKKEIGMHALRGGTIPGIHEAIYFGEDETISIKHNAQSRQIFVDGAVRAAHYLNQQPAGYYTMETMLQQALSANEI